MTRWDPDGAGPAAESLVVAGRFTVAGSVLANQIVAWDPAAGTWAALGSGMDGEVFALTTRPNGDLVAGGWFPTAGGLVVNNVATWNGTSWSPMGPGLGGVMALATLASGDVVACGAFGVQRWNGTSWSALGGGINANSMVKALTMLPSGDLIASGTFATIGGVTVNGIARWNGTVWAPLGSGLGASSFAQIAAVTVLPNGDVVAAGNFTMIGGLPIQGVARWNGAAWSSMGTGIGSVYALVTMANGDVVAGGSFLTAGGAPANNIARWNGTAWSTLATGVNTEVYSLTTLANGDLVAGGTFALAGGVPANRIARWNGTAWSAVASGMNNPVYALTSLPNGDVVAGGAFTSAGVVLADHIARWDGNSWSALGTGVSSGAGGYVRALATLPNGDVVAAGSFTMAGGVGANNIAVWDGTAWSVLGTGLSSGAFVAVRALATLPNGDIVAGGSFTMAGGVPANNIARWDGTAWSPLGSGVSGEVYSLACLPNGDLVAGGTFMTAGGAVANRIARWNGATWAPLGTGMDGALGPGVWTLTVLPNGDLVAGGRFTIAGGTAANRIARWNGATWSPLAAGVNDNVTAVVTLPNGDLMVGGAFSAAGLVAANNIARWNGTAWSALGQGLDEAVTALTLRANGDLVVGGTFARAENLLSIHVAHLTTTCPATAVVFGSGCAGSGGANTLSAASLPWTGSTFRAVATGMPANGITVAVHGFGNGSVPLQSILPQAVTGCWLLVSPDLLELFVPTGGTIATSVPIPNDVVLAGLNLHQQVVPFEFDLVGNITAVTSSNALTLTIGAF